MTPTITVKAFHELTCSGVARLLLIVPFSAVFDLVEKVFFCHLPHIPLLLRITCTLAPLESSLIFVWLTVLSQISISIPFILVAAVLPLTSIATFREIKALSPIPALIGFTLLPVEVLRSISTISIIPIAITLPVAPALGESLVH